MGYGNNGLGDYAYKRCRGIAHFWEPVLEPEDYPWLEVPERDRLSMVCKNCGDELFRAVDHLGVDRYTPLYRRPDDFSVEDAPPKNEWRRMVLDELHTERLELRQQRRATKGE